MGWRPGSNDQPEPTYGVWEVPEGEKLQEATLPYRPEDTNLLAVSPEGEVIPFGSAEGQIWFWQVAGAREVARLDLRAALEVGEGAHFRVAELAFAPDGELFILSLIHI